MAVVEGALDPQPPDGPNTALKERLETVGGRIRAARKQHKLSIQQLADETGLSTAMISLVERGMAVPSLGTLAAVASKLELSLGELFADDDHGEIDPVHRREDQRTIAAGPNVTRTVIFESTAEGFSISRDDWQPRSGGEPDPARHPGFELGYVISGELLVEVDGKQYHLSGGDCVAYPSTSLHRVENTGSKAASAIWVNLFRRAPGR